ncbi:DsbA family oxidoreductase [Wohlfahrtiimonas chitiniclastica]|uniref:DsbA family oxidoreductase n=1 Tax=Wohlfahrtiimonas chitiniclastica TaxID=400946 RepID=A0AB35BX93_9GAMM|nr:DsbA family oxidoreductase [Wohlfahrtiimonas chitiniclastica]MBS7816198.1 DsbA family oxidoreductase [Wohlfahrtiimonas chitiniclastica]MBS7821807.1 DsbA family oxidoreductase [Wohlfahrtiimonas chitiniclastica]MBS7823835.1 DsbA family oxidoreductase [Wohlfahrtiimonas chitiniclastica]MBS7829599.1 DsbA family oxidoreductase [Wohlfahrtiimonas chitiniclastica]MBS7831566.1 DsbA family oxidoreductase [Wohlfahrtiimonas chitiniclastica]
MKIEVWSDFSCPFCYIGVHNFYLALDAFNAEHQTEAMLLFKAYELSPDAPFATELSYYENLAQKYDVPLDRAKAMTDNAVVYAKEAGLTIDFDKVIPVTTTIAHRVAIWVQQHHVDKSRAFNMRLFEGYFAKGENIADDQVLAAILAEVGIEAINIADILTDHTISQAKDVDLAEAMGFGIKSVPFFVFNRTDAVAGAQTPVNFYQVIDKIHTTGTTEGLQ